MAGHSVGLFKSATTGMIKHSIPRSLTSADTRFRSPAAAVAVAAPAPTADVCLLSSRVEFPSSVQPFKQLLSNESEQKPRVEQQQAQQHQLRKQQQQGQQPKQSVPHHLRAWRPKWQLDKLHSIKSVCRVLQQQQEQLSPAQWVRGFIQIVRLVDEGQQVPTAGWQGLREALTYLTTTSTAHVQTQTTAVVHAGAAEAHPGAAHELPEGPSTAAQAAAQLEAAAAHGAGSPIHGFTAYQVATLVWAAAKLQLTPSATTWPVLLQHISTVSSSMTPRDISLTLWALSRLQPPVAVGWVVLQLLQGGSSGGPQPLQAYSAKSLSVLLYSLVKLQVLLPPAWEHELLEAVAVHIPTLSSNSNRSGFAPNTGGSGSNSSGGSSSSSSSSSDSRVLSRGLTGHDLSLLVWSLPGLHITPPAHFLMAVLSASKPHLPALSCADITALLVGVGRLRFVPPGPWLLECFDQLYWTLDQLSLRQLCGVVWALGRLRLVAVPPELLERLLAFVGVKLQEDQQQLERLSQRKTQQPQQQQQQCVQEGQLLQHKSSAHNKQQPQAPAAAAAAVDQQRFTLARQLGLLLTGLSGLSQQLTPQQQQQCRTWLLQVLKVSTPKAALQVAGSLHAAARLEVTVSSPSDYALVSSAVSTCLQGSQQLRSMALAVWGAVSVASTPMQQQQQLQQEQQPEQQQQQLQLQQWLDHTCSTLPTACVGELHMLLHACVLARQQPNEGWWAAAAQRLQQLVPNMTGRNCVFLSQLLLELLQLQNPQHQQHHIFQQQQQQQQVRSAALPAADDDDQAATAAAGVSPASVHALLQILAARVEWLEVQQHISSSTLQNFEHNRQLLTAMLQGHNTGPMAA